MPHDVQPDFQRYAPRDAVRSALRAPRIVVTSGMTGTGVTTIAEHLRAAAPALEIVDAGARWSDIERACNDGFARMVVVTTHDIVAITAAYALVKMTREQYPASTIEILVNRSEERDALRTYERIQVAASHFLNEAVGYAGAVPDDAEPDMRTQAHQASSRIGAAAVLALGDLAGRLESEELDHTGSRSMLRPGERRTA